MNLKAYYIALGWCGNKAVAENVAKSVMQANPNASLREINKGVEAALKPAPRPMAKVIDLFPA